jgi:hypothetical protein
MVGWGPCDADLVTPKDEQVEIELARRPAPSVAAAEGPLDAFEGGQQPQGSRGGVRAGGEVEGDDSVPELRLVGHPDGRRGIEARHAPQACPGECG